MAMPFVHKTIPVIHEWRKMNREEFLQSNIKKILISEGFSSEAAEVGADAALDVFHRKHDFFPKGKAFDFCLKKGRDAARRFQSSQRVR